MIPDGLTIQILQPERWTKELEDVHRFAYLLEAAPTHRNENGQIEAVLIVAEYVRRSDISRLMTAP